MATLRWMDVPEERMVEGKYEETKGTVICRVGISEEFMVKREGSALSPLLFIVVVEVFSRKTLRWTFSASCWRCPVGSSGQ